MLRAHSSEPLWPELPEGAFPLRLCTPSDAAGGRDYNKSISPPSGTALVTFLQFDSVAECPAFLQFQSVPGTDSS